MVNTYGRLNPMCVCVFKKTCASVDEWEHVLSVEGDVSITQAHVGPYEIFPSTLICMPSLNHSWMQSALE